MGYPNDRASSRTLPVLRRLVELGYAEQVDRTKFRPLYKAEDGHKETR